MTEIIRQQQQNSPTAFDFFNAAQFETMQRISKMFALSELVPDMYKVSKDVSLEKATANCMIAISLATRIQADPLMVMQNLVIIYGRPSWSAKFLVATVNTCGRFEPLNYRFTDRGPIGKIQITEYVWDQGKKKAVTKEFDGTKLQNLQCVAYSKNKLNGEELISSEVSILMAIQEGWYTKAGSKWKTMPKKMLMYRAASFWTNEYAPEISMGMKTDDEAYDLGPIDIQHEELPIDEKVKNTITDNANKTEVNFTDNGAQGTDGPKPGDNTQGENKKPEEPENYKNDPAIKPNTEFDKKHNQRADQKAGNQAADPNAGLFNNNPGTDQPGFK